MHPDTLHRVALSRVPGVGPILGRALYTHFGNAEAVFQASPKELKALEGVGDGLVRQIIGAQTLREAEGICRFAERHLIRIRHFSDVDYPGRFARRPGAPALFYSKGVADLNVPRSVAVIGTRKPSARGLQQTELLLSGLRDYGPTIFSGLAYGIDICAHREAMRVGLPTVGVLGSGLNQIYPSSHRNTAHQMLENGGLLTTYPHFTGPEREHFPARNRLVALLSDVVIVIESEEKGGSIITANMALELGKPVGAFPGRFDDPKSAGCNRLIRRVNGHLIEGASDVAAILGWQSSKVGNRQGSLFTQLSEPEQLIVSEIAEAEELALDELGRKLSWPSGQLASRLLSMECKGLIKVLPGHRYRLAY
ncbi:DNA protecting protein DprA [Lewinellaceae bacterium SD302]|nr:DNA protecting protein DprA [Lewinellaceae bacterium SD302]